MTDASIPRSDRDFDPDDLPILRLNPWEVDWGAFRTWHEALSGSIGPWLPHDLMGLWIMPPGRDPVLVGPEALEQDHLEVPRAAPYLPADALIALERRVRRAYPSVMTQTVRHGAMDVGLIMMADLRYGIYGEAEQNTLNDVARRIGPMMARVARRWDEVKLDDADPEMEAGERHADTPAERLVELFSEVGKAGIESSTPRDYARALGDALLPLLPHDHLEILIPDTGGEQWYRLADHDSGALWSQPALIVNRSHMDPGRIFEHGDRFISPDTALEPSGPIWPVQTLTRAGGGLRSAIGIRLHVLDRVTGYLFLGCHGRGFYSASDLDLLARVGDLVAPRVEGFVLLWQRHVLRGQLSMMRSVPGHLSTLTQVLATADELSGATLHFAREARQAMGFERLTFALHYGDTRVRLFEAGDDRTFDQLAEEDWADRSSAGVLKGELPYAIETDSDGMSCRVIVPLRAFNQVLGALVVMRTSAPYTRADATLAQQLADVIAPYFRMVVKADDSRTDENRTDRAVRR